MPQLVVENWTALMAPAATPDAIVAKLAAEVARIMATPELDERAKTQGFRIDMLGPREFGAFAASEVERWSKVIALAKISAE